MRFSFGVDRQLELNVVMLNFCYDVSVKLYSIHLLLMSLFLLLPDAYPIWKFLVERKEASLIGVWIPRFERKALRIGGLALQGMVAASALAMSLVSSYQDMRIRENLSPIQGVYSVDAANGFGSDAHWVQAFFDDRYGQHFFVLVGLDRKPRRFPVTYDKATQTIQFTKQDTAAIFHWSKNEVGEVVFVGKYRGETASMTMHKTSPETFALNTRGFHWITEDSYNH